MKCIMILSAVLLSSNAFASPAVSGSEAASFLGSILQQLGPKLTGKLVSLTGEPCEIAINALNEKTVDVSLTTSTRHVVFAAATEQTQASVSPDMSFISIKSNLGMLALKNINEDNKQFLIFSLVQGDYTKSCKVEVK